MTSANHPDEFRKSHPIDFRLLDQDDQSVMYISEDTDDWALHLTIANTSSQSITLTDGRDGAAPGNHHFALRFRAGTLSQRTLNLLTGDKAGNVLEPKEWALAKVDVPPVSLTASNPVAPAAPNAPAPNAPVTLYLRYAGTERVLAPDESRTLKLSGISAAPGSGARGTQVELIPNPAQVKYTSDQYGITGSRKQYVHVTNHSGRKNIPLHVGFVGGNQVLTGAQGRLTLRVTNVLRPGELGKPSTITFRGTGERPTKLVLSYDAGEDDWSLARAQAVAHLEPPADTRAVPFPQGDPPEWVITFNRDLVLESRQSFDIKVTDLAVSPTPGHANLYLRYENIPGYWDGQFVCTVEKGPIVVRGDRVGIGTEQPEATLDVVSTVRMGFDADRLKRYLWFRDDPYHPAGSNGPGDVGGIHVSGNCSELKVSAGYSAEQKLTPLPQISLIADRVTAAGELTAKSLTVTAGADESALAVRGQTTLDFGPCGALTFQGNNNGNPGIVAKRATAGLTFCAEKGANMPRLILGADEVLVSGRITVGEDMWRDVVDVGNSFAPFTSVASMKDSRGVVRLRGVLCVKDGAKNGDRICRLHPDHHPRSTPALYAIKGLTSSNDMVECQMVLVGPGPNIPADQVGWFNLTYFHFTPTKTISLDGVKFG